MTPEEFKIVLCAGCFDLIHVAHKRHLEEARSMGHYLVVGVTTDQGVGKGSGRPVIPAKERLEMVRALRWVDQAWLYPSGLDALKAWKPDVFVKGDDAKRRIPADVRRFCKDNGIKIAHTSPNPQSTTKIIEKIRCV